VTGITDASTELLEHRVIVSGIGISGVGRRSGVPAIEMTLAAIRLALEDGGLRPDEVDGLATTGGPPRVAVQDALGLRLSWGITCESGADANASGAQLAPFIAACMAVASGLAKHVLVYRTVEMMGGAIASAGPPSGLNEWLVPFHVHSAANLIALHARRHMHLYGTTREQLGWIALNARRHAALNDLAVHRTPMTMNDYLGARPISEPLGLYDCDIPIDGSVALVVSAADYAADCDAPVRIEAFAGGLDGRPSWDQRLDFPLTASSDAARRLWARTSLRPGDVDVAELYDGFTFLTLDWLEALGFCERGEGGPFVEGGTRIGLDGELPLNTYGGQLSAGRLHGYWVLHEACFQLQRRAGARQVPEAEVAVASVGGGHLAGCVLLTR
jgi:acetyl-CoA acetyltransferase